VRLKLTNYRLYNNLTFTLKIICRGFPIYHRNKKNKNKNNTLSTHLNTTNDLVDVIENMDDDSNNWTKVKSSKNGKRNHSSSSKQNSPQTPVNKNKKFFFSANRYEVLSQNDHETMLPMIDTTNTNIKKPVASLNVEPKIALPPTNIPKTTTRYSYYSVHKTH